MAHSKTNTRVPRWPFAQAVLVGFVAASTSAARASDMHADLSRKDFSVEKSARMMVVLTAASGQHALATCLHDQYFGSPLLLRKTLWNVWNDPSGNLETALLAATKAACSKNPSGVSASEQQTWLRTKNESVLLEPAKPTAAPAADMIAAYERMRGNHDTAQCALDQGNRNKADRLVSERLNTELRLPITLATYDAYRTLCGLNPNGPASRGITMPLMPDVATVARERLMIVQDFKICQSGSKPNLEACIRQAHQRRSKRLFNQLLSSDSRN